MDLLFAVTYHKLQGLTLNKLILTINKHPNRLLRLVLSSLYVGISRVHNMGEVRVSVNIFTVLPCIVIIISEQILAILNFKE